VIADAVIIISLITGEAIQRRLAVGDFWACAFASTLERQQPAPDRAVPSRQRIRQHARRRQWAATPNCRRRWMRCAARAPWSLRGRNGHHLISTNPPVASCRYIRGAASGVVDIRPGIMPTCSILPLVFSCIRGFI
jgi:hypothetical protein